MADNGALRGRLTGVDYKIEHCAGICC